MDSYASKLWSIVGSDKIFFDGSFLDKSGGIARESNAVLNHLSKDTQVVTYKNQKLIFENQILVDRTIRQVNFKAAFTKRPIFYPSEVNATILQPQVMPIKLSGNGTRFIRLHDLFPITNPEWFPYRQSIFFKKSIPCKAENIFFICVSYYTQEIFLRIFPEFKSRSEVLYCNTNNSFPEVSCGICEGCNFDTGLRYCLSVGTIEPRKNYQYLLSEIPENWSYKLVIVGKYGWKSSSILRQNVSGVSWLRSVCDGALKRLYESAEAYISASLDEGFNLPAFEARNFGIPLYLSDIPVHKELHRGYAEFFETKRGRLRAILQELSIKG